MKTKETIENLKDVRRNLWITVIGILGALSATVLNAKTFIFTWIVLPKLFIFILGILISFFFITEIIYCNKEINKLLSDLKEE